MRRALVLAGGGYVASSWEIGIVAGMAVVGLDVRDADLFVGTSAGARVALDLASGAPLDDLYRRRAEPIAATAPPRTVTGAEHGIDWPQIRALVEDARQAGGETSVILRRYGAIAMRVASSASPDRREIIASQLPLRDWPTQRVLITAVCAETGERRAFDRDSGLELVDAIIATTASFGASPVLFEGQHYIDGGYHSSDNADLAAGYERVLILALRSPPGAMRLVSIEESVELVRSTGSQVEVIHPDEATLTAMAPTGGQMNPASGRPAAIGGYEQGRRAAERIVSFWS